MRPGTAQAECTPRIITTNARCLSDFPAAGYLDLGGRPPLRFFRFACKRLKYSGPRLAISLPPFRPSLTAAGSFFRANTERVWLRSYYPHRGFLLPRADRRSDTLPRGSPACPSPHLRSILFANLNCRRLQAVAAPNLPINRPADCPTFPISTHTLSAHHAFSFFSPVPRHDKHVPPRASIPHPSQ